MTDAAQIEQALRQSLPPAQQGLAPQLAAILAAAASGMIGDDEARAQVSALPGADRAAQALISFGSAQTGDVRTGDIAGGDIFKLSLSLLAQPQRPQTQFYGDYTLPAIYVERDELLAQVREQLLTSPQSLALTSAMKVQRPAALHGMGGIGKTVLARALCDDPAIRAAFPDGIFWVTLGQTPELVRPLRGIVEQLGSIVSDSAPTPQSLKAQLAGLLEQKACLLIADDVWRKQDAELLRMGGPRCRLLATTRDAALVESIGAQIYQVPVMAPEQGRILLREWAEGALDATNDGLLNKIVRRLGALPLAIQLAGAQLRRKEPQQWLGEFDVRKLSNRRREQTHDSLELTFGLSLDQLSTNERRLYAALSIFREDEATPEVAVSRLWQGLAGFDANATAEFAEDLAARALLELRTEGTQRTIVLHDLLRDLMILELGETSRRTAHITFLNTYRQDGGHWANVNGDAYFYDHLVYHLQAALLYPEINRLFADQAWMQVRFEQREKLYDGYIEDLDQAIRLSQDLAKTEVSIGDPPLTLVEQVRYLLIRTSINSQARGYEPIFVAGAVARGLWSVEQAVSLARRIPDPELKAHMLIALLTNDLIPPTRIPHISNLALGAVMTVEDEAERGEALRDLASWLSGDQCANVLAALRNFQIEQSRATVLEALVPYLHRDQVDEALAIARDIGAEHLRVAVLSALAPMLSGEQVSQVLAAVYGIASEINQIKLLTALAPRLTGKLLTEALLATATTHRRQRIQLLQVLIPQITLDELREILLLHEALSWSNERQRALLIEGFGSEIHRGNRADVIAAAFSFSDSLQRVKVFVALASWFEGSELTEALVAAKQLHEDWQQAVLLESLIPYLQESQLIAALILALAMTEEDAQVTALCALVPRLDSSQVDKVFAVACTIDDWHLRIKLLAHLAPKLSEGQQREALAITRNVRDSSRADLIIALAPYLAKHLCSETLDVVRTFSSEDLQADIFTALAGRLDCGQYGVVLEVTGKFVSEQARAQVLKALAPHLNDVQLEYALLIARLLPSSDIRARSLLALASHSKGQAQAALLAETLSATLTVTERGVRQEILAHITPQLSDERLIEVMVSARTIYDSQFQARLLTLLAPYLTPAYRDEIIAIIQKLGGESKIVNELSALEVALNDAQLHEVMAATATLHNDWARAGALCLLIPQLTPQYLREAFAITHTIQNGHARISVLAVMAKTLPKESVLRIEAQKEIIALISAVASRSRRSLLALLFDAQPPLSFTLSPMIINQLAQQIIEICDEWQWL